MQKFDSYEPKTSLERCIAHESRKDKEYQSPIVAASSWGLSQKGRMRGCVTISRSLNPYTFFFDDGKLDERAT